MHAPPRRRWFQFSLTGMLLVVTMIAVTLGWEMNYIRQRKALYDLLVERGVFATKESAMLATSSQVGLLYIPDELPFWRRWLGDEAVGVIGLTADTLDLSNEAMRLFPESQIFDATTPLQPRVIQYWRTSHGDAK